MKNWLPKTSRGVLPGVVIAAAILITGCSQRVAIADACSPYLTQLLSDTATLSWSGSPGNELQYRPAGVAGEWSFAPPPTSHALWRQFTVTLTLLQPDTEYEYRLVRVSPDPGEPPSVSPSGTFRTAPQSDTACFSFDVCGDTQHAEMAQVFAEMVQQGQASFWLHPGDVVTWSSQAKWNEFFSNARPLLARIPLYPAYGNHDAPDLSVAQLFNLPPDRLWYSFDYGSVHIVALDTNSDYAPGSPQYQWLAADLAQAADRPWKIAFFHHPPYSPTLEDNTPDVRTYLAPLFETYGVAIVFNGHSHVYDRYYAGGIHYVVTGGGGGWALTHETSRFDAPFHFVRVNVSNDALEVRCIKPGGEIVDSFTISRE